MSSRGRRFELPAVGLGCSPYRRGAVIDFAPAIECALRLGYRLLDGAEMYGNESSIGRILVGSQGPPRDELTIVGKVWNTNHAYEDVLRSCAESLERLQIKAFDLFLVHSPNSWRHDGPIGDLSGLTSEQAQARLFPIGADGEIALANVPLAETWAAMEELERRGLTRAIGVSNFQRRDLDELMTGAELPPAVDQIEHLPYRTQDELIDFCRRREIRVMAHSPLSAAGLLQEPVLEEIGERHGKSPSQVVLRWNLERMVTPVPSSTRPSHLAENLDIFDFRLAAEETAAIDRLGQRSEND